MRNVKYVTSHACYGSCFTIGRYCTGHRPPDLKETAQVHTQCAHSKSNTDRLFLPSCVHTYNAALLGGGTPSAAQN